MADITTQNAKFGDTDNTLLLKIAKAIQAGITTVLGAGSAIIGKVGIDQTTPGTTNGVVTKGAALYANGQVATSGSAATLLAARSTRRAVLFKNLSSTAAEIVYIGAATVSSANGVPLKPGESVVLNITTIIQAISASGTPSVAYLEEYEA